MPVLDSLQYLQLHGAIDIPFTPPSRSKGKAKHIPIPLKNNNTASSIFWLDRKVVGDALNKILKDKFQEEDGGGDARRRRAREVVGEGWDLFLRVMSDGCVLVTAVVVSGRVFRRLRGADPLLCNSI